MKQQSPRKNIDGNGAAKGGTSVFNIEEDFIQLALDGWKNGKSSPSGMAKEYDFGRIIGIDMQENLTSRVRVALSTEYNGFSSAFPIPKL